MHGAGSICRSLAGSAPVAKRMGKRRPQQSNSSNAADVKTAFHRCRSGENFQAVEADRSKASAVPTAANVATKAITTSGPDFSVMPPSTTSSMPVTYFELVGGEKQRRVGDVPGVAHVAHRHLRVARAPHRLDIARRHSSPPAPRNARPSASSSGPGRMAVHPDMVRARTRPRWCASSGSSRPCVAP